METQIINVYINSIILNGAILTMGTYQVSFIECNSYNVLKRIVIFLDPFQDIFAKLENFLLLNPMVVKKTSFFKVTIQISWIANTLHLHLLLHPKGTGKTIGQESRSGYGVKQQKFASFYEVTSTCLWFLQLRIE